MEAPQAAETSVATVSILARVSAKFTPAASALIGTSPDSGLGSATSSYRRASGPPVSCTRIAFMICPFS